MTVISMKPWVVAEFKWGAALKHCNGKWERVFLKPSGIEIDVTNIDVILHDNGIEFL